MTDQVQHLIDRIRKDAVQTAEQHSQEVLNKAREQADAIVAEARAKAAAMGQQAERERQQLIDRGTQSLNQAARDLLLDVGGRFQTMLDQLMAAASKDAMTPALIEQMLLRLADGFAKNGIAEGQIDVLVSPADHKQLMTFALEKLRTKLEQGVEVSADQRLARGFRLVFAGGSVQHDFSSEAIAQALARLLRPQIADIVMSAALGKGARTSGVAAGKP